MFALPSKEHGSIALVNEYGRFEQGCVYTAYEGNSHNQISNVFVCVSPLQTTAWRLCPGVLSSLMSHTTSGQQTADRQTHHTQASDLQDAQQAALMHCSYDLCICFPT